MVFTFNPEATVGAGFIEQVKNLAIAAGGQVEFIELTAPLAELKRRLGSKSRHQHKKLTSVQFFEELHGQGAFDGSYMPKPKLSIDTSENQPPRAALLIARALDLLTV
jgi:hypothetical protein